MADLNNLSELIRKSGKNNVEFGIEIYPEMANETIMDKKKIGNQVQQLKKVVKSIKFETLERIAEATGADYNEILNYDNRK